MEMEIASVSHDHHWFLSLQTFHDKNINYGSLPSALRKAMIDRFPRFDQYQLGECFNSYPERDRKDSKIFFLLHNSEGEDIRKSDFNNRWIWTCLIVVLRNLVMQYWLNKKWHQVGTEMSTNMYTSNQVKHEEHCLVLQHFEVVRRGTVA